jgi:hypothetical protein
MIDRVHHRLKRSWHGLRRRLGADVGVPNRLIVTKAKWLHDAQSPVMLMVDDLANAWHNRNGSNIWEPGGDWGGGLGQSGSVLEFLKSSLLGEFPMVKVTFFVVAGPLSAYTHCQPFRYTASLDADGESRRFFSSLAEDPRFELAYHGFDHGMPGARTEDFVQEWRGFCSREAAIDQTKRGLEIFMRATGTTPRGGKYGGWEYDDFADQVVDECGFVWWCRDWTPRDVTGTIPDGYYEPQFFGTNFVVAIPSTLHGYYWGRRQVDLLLARRQVIAIEEHIAPIRPDGLVQTPNLIDDREALRGLFNYLARMNVWYATSSEIASYVVARERSILYDITREGFSVQYNGRLERPYLTLCIDCGAVCTPAEPLITLILPDGTYANLGDYRFDRERYRHLVTIPLLNGRYKVVSRSA